MKAKTHKFGPGLPSPTTHVAVDASGDKVLSALGIVELKCFQVINLEFLLGEWIVRTGEGMDYTQFSIRSEKRFNL